MCSPWVSYMLCHDVLVPGRLVFRMGRVLPCTQMTVCRTHVHASCASVLSLIGWHHVVAHLLGCLGVQRSVKCVYGTLDVAGINGVWFGCDGGSV